MVLLKRFQAYWPYWRRFGFRGRTIAQKLFPSDSPPVGTLGSVRLPWFYIPLIFRHGTVDASVFCEIFVECIYETKLPFSPKTIVDAGANVGFSALFFHKMYPTAEIVALEAEESNFALLKKNVLAYPKIRPLNAALWYKDGNVSLMNDQSTHSTFRFHDGLSEKNIVPALCPRSIMDEMNWSKIDLFKINIEGGERDLFGHEPLDWIPKVNAFAMDLHDRFLPGCSEVVNNVLVPAGFDHRFLGEIHLFLRATYPK